MIDSVEEVGAALGLAAFLGLAVLMLLYFQQARDVRRLREWAGKAPERAAAARQSAPTGEEAAAEPVKPAAPGRVGTALSGFGERFGERWQAVDRRSPLDLRVLVALVAAAVVAVGVLTSGFGLAGEEEVPGPPGAERAKPPPPEPSEIAVAVLNGTTTGAAPGVPGLAGEAGRRVSDAGFQLGAVGDTQTPFVTSAVMYGGGGRAEAKVLAEELEPELGALSIERMTGEIRALVEGADVVLVVGQDNAEL